jgi:hypothetical protein
VSSLLWVVVLVTSLKQPHEHIGMRFALPYDTRFTCEEAMEQVDMNFLMKFAEKHLDAERKHITVRRARTTCRPASPTI